MNLFGSGGNKSSATNNTASDASFDNNSGHMVWGDGDITNISTDHGAITAALSSNMSASQAALASNVETTKAALDASNLSSSLAFDFGAKALDSNSYTTGLAFENSAKALDTVSNFGGSVIDKINDLATTVLVNGEKATRGALDLAKSSTQSEAANITELMMKAVVVLGAVAIVGAVVVRGSKK